MILKNISYLDIEKEEIVENIDIKIKGGFIEAIGISDEFGIDCSNKLAIPALVNAHTHLGMAYFKNYADDLDLMQWLETKIWPLEAKLLPEDIFIASELSICELIRSGVGTFCDMYYEMQEVAVATEKSGLRGVLTRGLQDITGGGKERIEDFLNLYKNFKDKDRITIAPAPHAIYTCSKDYLKEILKLAKELDVLVHIHASETSKEVEDAIKNYGMTPIEYLYDLGFGEVRTVAAHCTHMTETEMRMVNRDRFFPVYNPTSNLKLASGFTPIAQMLKNNLTIALGTDGSSSNNNQDMFEEMHIGAIVNKAVERDPSVTPAFEIVKMATLNGQKTLGNSNLGIIKEGYRADIAMLDLDSLSFCPKNNLINALTYSARSFDVTDLLVDGKFILKDREILTMDEERIKSEVKSSFKKLLER